MCLPQQQQCTLTTTGQKCQRGDPCQSTYALCACTTALWHFCIDDVDAQLLGECGWEQARTPCTTAELAHDQYGADTYVALYGGAECFFTARLKD